MLIDFAVTATSDDLESPEAAQLPPNLFLGTSTWTFPGWRGVIYHRTYRNQRDFSQNCLAEYGTVPWFRTVCIDSLFYKPPSAETLAQYAGQLPATFRWVSKVWEHLTIVEFPRHPRYGALAGQRNPDFLNADLFRERILPAYDAPAVRERTGPFVFQFGAFPESVMPYPEFIERLGAFLVRLPRDLRYAVEVRNPGILSSAYFQALNETGATHCFNHWTGMVSLREQMLAAAAAGGLHADFFAARLLTPLGISYQAAEQIFEPYDKVIRPNPVMRAECLTLVKRGVALGKDVFITANNKAEGNSALTMVTIGRLASRLSYSQTPRGERLRE